LSNTNLVAFLDGDVLARPVTRTLIIMASQVTGLPVIWSRLAERQGNTNSPRNARSVTYVRELLGRSLSPRGVGSERFSGTSPADRQILADAVAAGAGVLVTGDVDDYGEEDLDAVGITAANPDLFLSIILTADSYLDVLEQITAGRRKPPQTVGVLHGLLGRQHPRTVARFASLFNIEPSATTQREPHLMVRGRRCLRCYALASLTSTYTLGLCEVCATVQPNKK